MLFDTSVKDKKVKQQINQLVGKPFNLIEIFKRGAIGSSRMEVVGYSKLFNDIMAWNKQAIYANLSMRPNGLLVIINVRLSNYSWVIPYHYLSIFKTKLLVIHSQGEFLKLKISPNQNRKLIDKILIEKAIRNPDQDYFV